MSRKQDRVGMKISQNWLRIIYWAPRILTIIFGVFISLFALDVFSEGFTGWELILALVLHLVPTYIITIVLCLAWKWAWTGTVAFCLLGVYYIVMTQGRFPPITYLLISGPLFVIGGLFLLSWYWRRPNNQQPQD